mmetsp:Transcript_12893/g.15084  ORF Transcript_12893/g.15084 Transcript_12893/m.15084 type:complete len:167 (+) Transcript_12893:212-712(+)
MEHQDVIQTPTYVRLKFFGEGLKLIQGSFKDVQIKSRSIQELSDVAVQWLGSPGAWQLATVANWPLTDEALQRPTTERSPLVVHVWNSQAKLSKDIQMLRDKVSKFQEDVDKRLKDMDGEIDKKVENVQEQGVKIEEYMTSSSLLSFVKFPDISVFTRCNSLPLPR